MYRQRPPDPPRVRNEPVGGAITQCCARWTACAHSEGARRTFPLRRDPRGVALCPRSARLTVQLLVLFVPVLRHRWFRFHIFPPPPATMPLTGRPGPTNHRGCEARAWCERLFGFSSIAVEFKGGEALLKGMRHRDRLSFHTCFL
jgi:hypothetical protein